MNEVAVFSWIWLFTGGLIAFVGVCLVLLNLPYSETSLDREEVRERLNVESRRYRVKAYKVILSGLLAPVFIPYWVGYGIGALVGDVRQIGRAEQR